MLALILLLALPLVEIVALPFVVRKKIIWAALLPLALAQLIVAAAWSVFVGLDERGFPTLQAAATFAGWHLVSILLLYALNRPPHRNLWRVATLSVVACFFISGSMITHRFESFWSGLISATTVFSLVVPVFTLRVDHPRVRAFGAAAWASFPLACLGASIAYVLEISATSGALPPPAAAVPTMEKVGIIHCHMRFSHDSEGTLEEIVQAAKTTGVDFIMMTDHPPKDDPGRPLREGPRGKIDGIWFFQGAELRGVMGINLQSPVDSRSTAENIRAIHEQKGLAILCHPEEITDWSIEGFDGMEVYNAHADVKEEHKGKLLARVAQWAEKDPARLFLAFLNRWDPILAKWDELGKTRRVPGVAANDAHQNVRLGPLLLDPYPRAFQFVRTHVQVDADQPESILRALAAGRCFIGFDVIADTRGFDLRAADHVMGEEFKFSSPLELTWKLPPAAVEPVVSVYQDGKLVGTYTNGKSGHPVGGPGVYRIEVTAVCQGERFPWIFSNPIYVRP